MNLAKKRKKSKKTATKTRTKNNSKKKNKKQGSKKRGTKKGLKQQTKIKITAIVAFAIFVVSLLGGMLATALTVGSKVSYEFEQNTVATGIDVSKHNGKIDWDEAKSEIDFAFIRAGFRGYANGKLATDPQLKRNLKKANSNDIPVGVYFFSQAISVEEAIEEAEYTVKLVRHYDIGLPIVIDFEYAYEADGSIGGRLYKAKLSKKDATEIINAFCKTVEDAGYKSACYASSYFYKSKIEPKNLNDSIIIWVADYNKNVTYKGDYDIWQYTKTGKCKGVSSRYVDMNYWYNKK